MCKSRRRSIPFEECVDHIYPPEKPSCIRAHRHALSAIKLEIYSPLPEGPDFGRELSPCESSKVGE